MRITALPLAVMVAAATFALAAPASAGGFHRGGLKGYHGHYGHGFKHFGHTGFYGSGCLWKYNGFKRVKFCY